MGEQGDKMGRTDYALDPIFGYGGNMYLNYYYRFVGLCSLLPPSVYAEACSTRVVVCYLIVRL